MKRTFTFIVILLVGFMSLFAQPHDIIDLKPIVFEYFPIYEAAYVLESSWGDIDGDGDFDIAVGCDTPEGYWFSICINDGSNSFVVHNLDFDKSFVSPRIEFQDFDNDNIPEVFVAGEYAANRMSHIHRGSKVRIWKYSGNTIVDFFSYDEAGEFIYNHGSADFDGDGDVDFHFGEKVFENSSGQFFYLHKQIIDYPDVVWSDNTPLNSTTDIDGDGDLDSINMRYMYINLAGDMGFEKPSVPILNQVESSSRYNVAAFNWEPSTDPDSPINSISYNFRLGTKANASDVVSPSADLVSGLKRTSNIGNMGYYNMPVKIVNLSPGLTYYWSVQSVDEYGFSSVFSEEQSFLYSDFLRGTSGWARISGLCLPGDFDRDGEFDFFSGALLPWTNGGYNEDVGIHITDSTYTTVSDLSFGNVSYTPYAALTDFNNDGNLDIAAVDNDFFGDGISRPYIFRNNGNGSFEKLNLPLRSIEGSTISSSVSVTDFNNDGYQDILLLSEHRTYLLRNQKDFQFEIFDSLQIVAVDSGFTAWVDYDNDLDEDLLISGIDVNGNYICRLYSNNNSDFYPVQSDIIALSKGSADWGDYDNDGDMDLLITGNDLSGIPTTRVYRNDITQFEDIGADFIGIGYSQYQHPVGGELLEQRSFGKWGDFDNDGFLDFALHGGDKLNANVAEIYWSNKLGGFDLIPSGFRICKSGSMMIGDFYDGDGDLDIIFTGDADETDIRLFFNSPYRNTNTQNYNPNQPSNLRFDIDGYDVVLSWDAAGDQESGDHLSYNLRIGSTPGGIDIMSPMSFITTGKRLVVGAGNTGTNLMWSIKNLSTGTYYWSVQAIDQSFNGGSWAPEQSFSINTLQSDFEADTVCLGMHTSFTNLTFNEDPVLSWDWEFGDGGGSSSEEHPQYTYSNYGEYDVSLTAHTASYENKISKKVIVKPIITADFTATEVCQGEATTFSNISVTDDLVVSYWRWQYGDDSPDATAENPPPHLYLAGAYDVSLEVMAENGCKNEVQHEVIVGTIPSDILNTKGDLDFCVGDSVVFTAESHPNFQYEWRVNNVPILNQIENVFVAYTSGIYTAKITNLVGNCTATSQEYAVSAISLPPVPEIVSENYIMGNCPLEEPVILSILNPIDQLSFQWKLDGKLLSGEDNPSLTGFLEEGNYSIEVDQSGCVSESDIFLIEYAEIPAKPDLYAVGPNVWYLACSNDNALSYKWYLNDQLIDGAGTYLYVAGQTYGKYHVSISEGGECYATSDPVWIPFSTGIDTKFWENLKMYPNPTPGVFSIEMDNPMMGELIFDIFTEAGYKILNIEFLKETSHFKCEIDMSRQPAGLYLIGIRLDKEKTTRKLLVQ